MTKNFLRHYICGNIKLLLGHITAYPKPCLCNHNFLGWPHTNSFHQLEEWHATAKSFICPQDAQPCHKSTAQKLSELNPCTVSNQNQLAKKAGLLTVVIAPL